MEKKTREEAEKLLKEWADFLELDTSRSLYDDLVEDLRMPVMNNRLTFDMDTELFSYHMIKPIDGKEIVHIEECDYNAKKVLQSYKDKEGVLMAMKTISIYTNLSVGEVEKLKDRDRNHITAVLMGFLAQTAPGAS
jgi:hypothetical protein